MKKKILLLITGLSLSFLICAQALFVPTGTNGVGISANNNVGIGTSTPGAKLEVSGDIFGSLDNSVITVKDDNIGLVKKWADSGVWAVGYNYCHRFGKWSTASLIGNVSSGSFTEQMRIANNGNVGIGTTNPIDRLEISGGNIIVNRPSNKVDRNGISELSAFEINNSFTPGQTGYVKVFYPSYNNLLFGADYDGNIGGVQPNIQFGKRDQPFLTVVNNGGYAGNIGIGTTNPDEKLTVNGVIHAKEVKVDLSGALADFVFKPDYKLISLPQVEQFVKANNHLPQMPSANEVAKNGLSMGEMQNKLLQKVEELTLYAIQQNKKIVEQDKKNNELELELNTLKKVVANEIVGRK